MSEQLQVLAPDSSRTARTMARCHAALATRRRKIEARNRLAKPRGLAVERLFLTGLCVMYLISMAGTVFTVIGPL